MEKVQTNSKLVFLEVMLNLPSFLLVMKLLMKI